MIKATHFGHCQLCDRRQKLPGGVMAKHGYTKQWSYFEGVCAGSGHFAFEISTDQIPHAIANAESIVAMRWASVERMMTAPVATKAPFLYHQYANISGTKAQEVEAEIVAEPRHSEHGEYFENFIVTPNGKRHPATRWSLSGTVGEIVVKLRELRRGRIERDIKQYQEYIDWQRGRLKTWKRKPLEVVK